MSLIRPITARAETKSDRLSEAEKKSVSDARRLINEALSTRGEWSVLWRVQAEIDQLEGNIKGAIANYQKALESSHSGQTVVARRLVQLLCATRQFAEADKVLKYVGELGAADPLRKMTQVIDLEKGDTTQALAKAEEDAKADPKNPATWIWYGQVLDQAGGRSDEAAEAFRKATVVGADLPQAWLLLVRNLMNNKKKPLALEAIRKAAPHLEKDPATLAQLYELAGDGKQAEELYQAALDAKPDDLTALHQMVQFFITSAQSGQAADTGKAPSSAAGAAKDQFLPQISKAGPYLERIIKKTKDSSDPAMVRELGWARRARAEIIAAAGDYDHVIEATKLIELNAKDGVLPPQDTLTIINMLSKRSEPASRAKCIELLEQLQKQRPLLPREQLALGQLYERSGDWGRAKDLMVESLSRQGNDPATLAAFARALIAHGENDDAARWLDKLDSLLTNAPAHVIEANKPTAHELRALVLSKMGQPEQAVAVLEQLVPSPLPPNQLYRLEEVARMLEELEQYDAAKKLLDEYVQQDPRGTIAMAAFVGRRGDLDQAFKLLDESRKNQSVAEIVSVGMELLRRNPDQQTAERFKTLEEWGKAGAAIGTRGPAN